MKRFPLVFFVFVSMAFLWIACSQDDDGPLNISSSENSYSGNGFFLTAQLDSGKIIHLASDTLFMLLDSVWTYDNCSLEKINVETEYKDSLLILKPKISYRSSSEDCASPFYRPDTTVKITFDVYSLMGISQINVHDDKDSVLDSIYVRHGTFKLDTFNIYIDSLYDSVKTLPLRTKDSPSMLKVLDSLTPRVYHWRPMESKCNFKVDKCDKVVADTLYPNYWSLLDTTPVPIRQKCADSTMIFCKKNGWEDDSLALGSVQDRKDTIWHTHLYYIEEIPECGAVNQFVSGAYGTKREMKIIRELYTPNALERFCGPSSAKNVFVYDYSIGRMMPDTLDVDALLSTWKKAKVSVGAPKKK